MTFSHDGLRDSLTAFAAPPYFYEYLTRELAKHARNNSPFTAVRIVMPSQSLYEERILALAHAISRSIRVEDIAARMGENEFVLIFSDMQMAPLDLGERITLAWQESGESAPRFTLSQTSVQDGDTPAKLLDRLDLAQGQEVHAHP